MGLVVPFLLFVQRLWFVCDDAWISFRYARNLADGHGLRYNLGDHVPVEGYSNFLWTVLAAVPESVDADPGVWMTRLSAACGLGLLLHVTHVAWSRLGLGRVGGGLAGLFLAASPAFAAWSTGGLATMPAAWALFALVDLWCLASPTPRRAWLGALAALALALLRVEGLYWVLVVAGLALAVPVDGSGAHRTAWRRLRGPLALVLAGIGLHTAWRAATYGSLVAATAKAKVGLSGDRLWRGLLYVGGMLVALVAPGLAFPALPGALRHADRRWRTVALLAGGVVAYAVLVGGDYMAFGRMLVPSLPFVALLVGRWADGARLPVRIGVAAVCVVGALPGLGQELAPEPLRDAFFVRHTTPRVRTEHHMWTYMSNNAARWRTQGLALRAAVPAGSSLVTGAIGARGYFSELFLWDRGGLVSAEVHALPRDIDPLRASPGHDRTAPWDFFLQFEPDVLRFKVLPGGASDARVAAEIRQLRARSAWRDRYAPVIRRVSVDGADWQVLLLARQPSAEAARAAWEAVDLLGDGGDDTGAPDDGP